MQGIGTPQKILDLQRALHSDTSSRVRDSGGARVLDQGGAQFIQ